MSSNASSNSNISSSNIISTISNAASSSINSNIISNSTNNVSIVTTNDNIKMDISTSPSDASSSSLNDYVLANDIITKLYPNVNQKDTPLPRQWSTQYKFQTLSLSNGNLRVTYKGPGKTHKDAASVRTDYSIPSACGIYYFEIKIISKGRDGYMGIGLSKSDVHLNRLPGWDKNSYGYHGDDGHSFCCSGTGQNYGPTFTTGDVIGCCLNLIENTCFYTKNGYNLGIAFRDLPGELHPTVGLQTPSESVEANFGQKQFEFDINNYIKEWHLKTRNTIEKFPMKKENENNLPIVLRKLISTYLVHHGYSSTAEAFAKSVGHVFEEELASIRNRQKIQKAVINGHIGEAIDLTRQLFPGILEKNTNLLFALKIRQFIEMVNGTDNEITKMSNNKTFNNNNSLNSATFQIRKKSKSRQSSPADNTLLNSNNNNNNNSSRSASPFNTNNNNHQSLRNDLNGNSNISEIRVCNDDDLLTIDNVNHTDSSCSIGAVGGSGDKNSMDIDHITNTQSNSSNSHSLIENNNSSTLLHESNGNSNGHSDIRDMDGETLMEMDGVACTTYNNNSNESKPSSSFSGHNDSNLQKILKFGRELFQLSLVKEHSDNVNNQRLLRDAFSLLAYHDPWNSPVGYQLDSSQREPISAMLNSAILEANNMPRIPPLEVVYGQTSECMKLMSKYGVAWCAYVNLTDYMQS